ncbi:MAG: hypothetical protein WKG06_32695 [Segetibacter sp.]
MIAPKQDYCCAKNILPIGISFSNIDSKKLFLLDGDELPEKEPAITNAPPENANSFKASPHEPKWLSLCGIDEKKIGDMTNNDECKEVKP